MNCPNCNCPDEMNEVRYRNRKNYMCLDCNYAEDRRDLAIDRKCPACQSPAGKKCTQPTDTGRVPVEWFHSARACPE